MERRISARGWLGSMGGWFVAVTVAGIAPGLNWGGGTKNSWAFLPTAVGRARLGAGCVQLGRAPEWTDRRVFSGRF